MLDACTAKFRREFGWACRTGCGPRPDLQQMPFKTTQLRTRDKMTDTVGGRDIVRDTGRPLIFRFSDVIRREIPAGSATATAAAAATTTNITSPPAADVVVT